ncbi:MAG: cyclic nucleotide-binding domain-containing protein [Planctomycetota bacterium]
MSDRFLDALRRFPLFSTLSEAGFDQLAQHHRREVIEPGAPLLTQGDYRDRFCVLVSGVATCFLVEPDGIRRDLGTLGPGDFFGELAAVSGQPATTSVVAESRCTMIVLEQPLFRTLYLESSFAGAIDGAYRDRALALHLRVAPLLRSLSAQDLDHLREVAEIDVYPKGTSIALEGAPADALYLVRAGAVKSSVREGAERVTGYYMANSSFGEHAFLDDNATWAHTYVAMAKTDVVKIPRETARSVLANSADAMRELEANARRIFDEDELEVMAQHQSAKGGDALAIDLHRCIRCNVCVESCVAVHEDRVPRLSKRGHRVYAGETPVTLATSCYHCDIPECMLACGFGAIRRDSLGMVRFVESNCIGCGACSLSCPYGVIRMTPAPGSGERRGIEQYKLWETLPFVGEKLYQKRLAKLDAEENAAKTDEPVLNAQGLPVTAKAIKCDRCEGLPFEACVYNCPTEAIRRTDPGSLFRKPTP